MQRTNVRRIVLLTSAVTSLWAMPALAQDTGSEDSAGSGNDIVVTARRTEEKLLDVPISITVYNQEQLSNRNIANSADLAAYTPSLTVNSRFGPEKASFAIRGFSQDLNTLPTVGVYFADVVAPRLSSNITSGNGAGVGSMFDLQNVQVLKGPQGTLFGRNTTGGAILLVPQKPKDTFGGYAEASVGNHNAYRLEAVVNVPISDTVRIRAGIDRYKRDGYLNNRSGIGPDKFNDINYFAARLGIVADLTPDLENYTLFTYSRSHTNGSTGKIVLCDPTAATSFGAGFRDALCTQLANEATQKFGYYDVSGTDPDADLLQTTWQIINTTTWKASENLTVKNIFSYGQSKERYSFNIEGDFPVVAPLTVPTPFVTTYGGPNNGQGDQWTLTEELQLIGQTSDGRLTWQAGGYMELSRPNSGQEQYTAVASNCTDIHNFKCTTLSPILSSIGIAKNNYYYRNFGLYAQATFKITNQLSLTAGIRNTWDWVKEDADNIRVTPSPTGPLSITCSRAATPANPSAPAPNTALLTNGACGIGRTFLTESSKPTWLVGLDYKPTTDMLVYAKYARGYRGGGVNEANRLFEVWQPEFVDAYEIGLKASWRGAVRGNVSIAGFWNDFKSQQVSIFIPQCTNTPAAPDPLCTAPAFTGINGIQNLGKSRLRGIELDGSLFFGDNLRLDVGYAYLDATVITGSAGTFTCARESFRCDRAVFLTPGLALPFAPKNRVTITGTYTLPLPESIGRISLGATFTHTDEQFSNHGGDAAFAAGRIPFNPSITPPTDLLTLNLNWKDVGGKPIDLSLFATNVTNQKYYVASANGLSSLGAEFVFLGEPRMFGMRVKVRFGD
ncbi:MAG: TonB-dependent receptor [Novosphingobium sp.]